MTGFSAAYLTQAQTVLSKIDAAAVDAVAELLGRVKARAGRLFILGVGGSAANAGHAAADFRKQAGLEAYAPTDAIAELTARTNDEGWDAVFLGFLKFSRFSRNDAILVLSVGGGDKEKGTSLNLMSAIDYAKSLGAPVAGIVGKSSGYTAVHADAAIVIPPLFPENAGAHAIGLAPVVWKALTAHPQLRN